MECILSTFQQHAVQIRGDRSLYWQRERTLFVADLHLGKDKAFRAQGIPVPTGATKDDLERLADALRATHAERLVILGDLLHGPEGCSSELIDTLRQWRRGFKALLITLVLGNHDRRVAIPTEWNLDLHDGTLDIGPYACCHEPPTTPQRFYLAGHLHPVVQLDARGRMRQRLRCLWVRPTGAVLPAFGSFTGGYRIRPSKGDQVWAFRDGQVAAVSLSRTSEETGPRRKAEQHR
ncbi:MAG: ligase-associated DNA damage response endonuclease PdeM [Bdellovibrionales bacterium]|nr:ligase-associated DNA damage response endonuclease PdeM [Bdellovibrionales bacterium]